MDKLTDKLSGRTAVVRLHENTVTLSTEYGLPGQKAELKKKIDLMEKLRELTSDINGLKIPRILNRDDARGEYEVERASGCNLSEQQGFKQGKTDNFFRISTEAKVRGLTTYFKMIGKLNEDGWSFTDHKPDSVFLEQDGTITIVDSDGMEPNKSAWNVDKNPRNGILDIVGGFFNRGMQEMTLGELPELLIPAGITAITSDFEETKSATVVADRIEGWSRNTYDPAKHYGYNAGMHRQDIWKEGMTSFQYDVAESNFYKDFALGSKSFSYYSEYLTKNGL